MKKMFCKVFDVLYFIVGTCGLVLFTFDLVPENLTYNSTFGFIFAYLTYPYAKRLFLSEK